MFRNNRAPGPPRERPGNRNISRLSSRRAVQSQAGHAYDPLEGRLALANIQILAAGITGQETVELQIDGQTVRSWNNVGGNAAGGQFWTLAHSVPGSLSADRVRVAFTNDLSSAAAGVDRGVRIDALAIDGDWFETEGPRVWSTGTWLPEDGLQPGFRRSEFLHANGYFQYSSTIGGSGTAIQIRASGDTGEERMELRVDGRAVASFIVARDWRTYEYRATGNVALSQVEVAFSNDFWDPTAGVDRNLNVDWISVGGSAVSTRSPGVYASGVWVDGLGLQAGFLQSATLHSTGAFQFGRSPQAGVIRLETNVLRVAESAGRVAVTVQRVGGSDGTVSVGFQTVALTAQAGMDFAPQTGRVTFAPGETSRTVFVSVNDDATVEGDEQFSVTIDNVTGGASLLSPRTVTVTIVDNDGLRGTGTGLRGEYFDRPDFTALVAGRVDATVNYSWGQVAPVPGVAPTTWSARWTGMVEPTSTGSWSFRVQADGGVRLWVDDRLVIDDWRDQGDAARTGTAVLQRGVPAPIRLEYLQVGGNASARLSWSSATQPLEIIPAVRLYPADQPAVSGTGGPVAETVVGGLDGPTSIEFSADGRNMYIGEYRGAVRVMRDGVLLPGTVLDFSDRVNGYRGLSDIAVHPDLANHPYLYLSYTYDPPETAAYPQGSLAGRDGLGNRAGRVTRVTLNPATGYTTIVPGSETVILGRNGTWQNFNGFVNSTVNFDEPPAGILPDGTNLRDFVNTDSDGHFIDSVEFGPDGKLYVSIGDGASYNQADWRAARVQDVNNLSGKILRIDPINGDGQADNPFYDGDPGSNRSKVWQYGLRNPYRYAFQPGTGALFVGDVGWSQWEEINAAGPGANFGWPWYEGGNGENLRTVGYQNLPAAAAFYASGVTVTPSIFGMNHAATGIDALILGDFYSGSVYPAQYQGNLFFSELGTGIVRNMKFTPSGAVASVETFATGQRYLLQIRQGPDGFLYFVDLDDDLIGRWRFAPGGDSASPGSSFSDDVAFGSVAPAPGAGQGVTVAVIDSGLNATLPDFAGRLWTNPGEIDGDGIDNDGNGYVDDRNGYDFSGQQGEVSDGQGLGSALASLIAGNGRGIAALSRIMPLRVLNPAGAGSADDVARAIRYAVDQGAQVICLPVRVSDADVVRESLAHAARRNVLVIAAAGNDGRSEAGSAGLWSAEFTNVLAVGGLTADGERLPESNRAGNPAVVQLDALGVAAGVASSGVARIMRGTGVSAAIASGIAAAAWSRKPALGAAQIRELLVASATRPGRGSDSAGTLDPAAAVSLASRMGTLQFVPDAGRLTVRGTGGDDRFWYETGQPWVRINGITIPFNVPALPSQLVLDGRGGTDSIVLVGTVGGSDYGLLKPDWISLTTAGQFIRGAGFERMTLVAGDGDTRLDVDDSPGDDRLGAEEGLVRLVTEGRTLEGRLFRNTRIFGATGNDTGGMRGTAGNDVVLARPWLTRLTSGSKSVQVNGFDNLLVGLGDGFDQVIFEGSYLDESLTLWPSGGEFRGAGFTVTVDGAERTTSYGHGGFDDAVVQDSPQRETVNSSPLNTLVVGPGYDHRLWSFERTEIRSSGGNDHATLRGSAGREALEWTPGQARLQGSSWETVLSSFSSVLFFGDGGDDEATLTGSPGMDWFWAAPDRAVLQAAGAAVTVRDIPVVRFAGGGGFDVAALVDGPGSDRLRLWRSRSELAGPGYRIEVQGAGKLRATSAIDPVPDWIRFEDPVLDYQFERFGDWQVEA